MRIIFAGTPEFAAKALEALIQSEHEVVMVLSQPDRPAGRRSHPQSPERAEHRNAPDGHAETACPAPGCGDRWRWPE